MLVSVRIAVFYEVILCRLLELYLPFFTLIVEVTRISEKSVCLNWNIRHHIAGDSSVKKKGVSWENTKTLFSLSLMREAAIIPDTSVHI
jgi:hypothetical protein